MRWPKLLISLLVLAPLAFAQAPMVNVLLDLSHGEASKGIDLWYEHAHDFVKLTVLVPKGYTPPEELAKLVEARAVSLVEGDLAAIDLSPYDVIVIGQPTSYLSEDELTALVKWLEGGRRALWCAADSDYPAQGSEEAQKACDMVFEAVGSHLRVDYVSIEDPIHNCYAGYRVVALISPPPELAVLAYNAQRVLFHGPGAISVVLPDGTWVKANDPRAEKAYPNIYPIAVTTKSGRVVEHRTSAGGRGLDGRAYEVGEVGSFVLLAAERLGDDVIIASGETPYGGYEPMVAPSYKGVGLDGPQFVRNLLQWATGYYRETSYLAPIVDGIISMSKHLDSVRDEIRDIRKTIEEQGVKVDEVSSKLKALSSSVEEVKTSLGDEIKALRGEVEGVRTVALAGSIIAIIIAIVAIALALRRK